MKTPELVIVMPVYNEQASVRKVVLEWFQELESWTENFCFIAINDGSRDKTLEVLQRLQEQLGKPLRIHTHNNRGRGQSCLAGYRLAHELGATWVLQIDSDGQCDPQYFFRFWGQRDKFDVIYGVRKRRDDGFKRVIASWVLRFVLLFSSGAWCEDANVPYRLMRADNLSRFLDRIPSSFFLANVALAVLMKKERGLRHGTVPIRFRERYGGEPSVRLGKFGEKAAELVSQLKKIKAIES